MDIGSHDVSQKALDLNFDGLMIESHIDPDSALSDKSQQVTPEVLDQILNSLIIRKSDIEDQIFKTNLEELRGLIDILDLELLDTLENRMNVAEVIGENKKENGVTILQTDRWEEMLESRINAGIKKGLSKEFMVRILKAIHQESINRQTMVMNSKVDNLTKSH